MTIAVPTKPFRDALQKLQPITSGKGLPQLGAVTIDVGFNGVELSATNTDQWMRLTTTGDSDMEVDAFSASSKDLFDTLRLVDAEETVLKVAYGTCTVTAGSSTHQMPLIVDPVPVLPEAEWGEPFVIENLPGLLFKCLPFASTDPNRYILNGIYFCGQGLVATNGYSMIKIGVNAAPINPIDDTFLGQTRSANVPTAACKLIASESGDVTVRFSANLAEFAGDGWSLTTKCIEGADGSKFPSIEPLLKWKIVQKMTCNRKELIKAAAFAALPLPVECDTVSAEHTPESLQVFTGQNKVNQRTRTLQCQADQGHKWGVSSRKLAAMLGAFDSESVEIGFSEMDSAVVVDGNILSFLMLCRL